jgi:nucleoside-diphosphate-sugar epimerase
LQFVYAPDVGRAAILASEADVAAGHAYSLANYPPISQIDFVRLLARVAGTEADLVHVPRERIQKLGGGVMSPPLYFGAYLDIPPITVVADRVRSELGLDLTPLEAGFAEAFRWYNQQDRPTPDFSWEDRAMGMRG